MIPTKDKLLLNTKTIKLIYRLKQLINSQAKLDFTSIDRWIQLSNIDSLYPDNLCALILSWVFITNSNTSVIYTGFCPKEHELFKQCEPPTNKEYVCTECNKTYAAEFIAIELMLSNYKMSISTNTGRCSFCGKLSSSSNQLVVSSLDPTKKICKNCIKAAKQSI